MYQCCFCKCFDRYLCLCPHSQQTFLLLLLLTSFGFFEFRWSWHMSNWLTAFLALSALQPCTFFKWRGCLYTLEPQLRRGQRNLFFLFGFASFSSSSSSLLLYFLTIPIDCCLYYLSYSFLGSLILSDFGAIFFSCLLIENQNYSQIFLVSFLLWRLSLALLSLLPFAPGPIIHSRFQCPVDRFWLLLCTVLWEPKCVSQPKKVKQFFTIYTD